MNGTWRSCNPWGVRVLSIISLGVALTGCSHGQSRQPLKTPPLEQRKLAIEAGDVLQITVYGEKELSGKFQVSQSGTIDYPLVGRVKTAGLAPPEVATLLTKRLGQKYLKNPYVAVFAEGFNAKKTIYVWGQVRKSGAFEFTSPMPLIKALTLAGGLTPLADRGGITISRVERGRRKEYAAPMTEGQSSNHRLKPGDVVFVPEGIF